MRSNSELATRAITLIPTTGLTPDTDPRYVGGSGLVELKDDVGHGPPGDQYGSRWTGTPSVLDPGTEDDS